MIVKDSYGYIVQHPSMDGGDSAARMGIYSLENVADKLLLSTFFKYGGIVRHPYQEDWNKPGLESRDQVVQLAVGIDESHHQDCRDTLFKYAITGRINKDYLGSDVRLYLATVSGKELPYKIENQGRKWMKLSMIWNTEVDPDSELNMFSCMCIRLGKPYAKELIEEHPNIENNFADYWNGWRDQREIGEIIFRTLKKVAYG